MYHRAWQTVVDLWGGMARPETQTPWTARQISIVFSSTKGATALCPHTGVTRKTRSGAPVAKYWPEFAQAGKAQIPVKMLLNHQAGLPAVRAPLPQGAYANWELMVNALAKEEPFWEPGTRNGYHAFTIGWLVGEVVRRVSGKSLGTFFQDEVAKPLGLDFWIGLPEDKEARVAPMIAAAPDTDSLLYKEMIKPGSLASLAILNSGGYMGAKPSMTFGQPMPRRLVELVASRTHAAWQACMRHSPAGEHSKAYTGESRQLARMARCLLQREETPYWSCHRDSPWAI